MKKNDREEYIDEIIATCVDIDPMAMYYVLERMNAKTHPTADLMEKDAMLSACVDEITAGIDESFGQMSNNLEKQASIFKNDLDRWIESQPELKYASKDMMQSYPIDRQHDFVWFESPMDLGFDVLPDLSQKLEKINKPIDNDLSHDFVWFGNSLDKWLESQPDLKKALDQLNKPTYDDKKSEIQVRKVKVA